MAELAKILVVDDDADNQQMLCALLEQMGYATAVADGGAEALRLLERDRAIALVFSDVIMPGMSGIDFARRVRATLPHTPVVLVTGNAAAVDTVVAAGSVALLKPYSSERLRRVVLDTLGLGRH